MKRLLNYFTDGISSQTLETVGAEIETQFVNQKDGRAVETKTSQKMLRQLLERGWKIDCRKGELITTVVDNRGNKIFYELGRHNMEVATTTSTPEKVISVAEECLFQLYEAARRLKAEPLFSPILEGREDLLVVPDERDATWLELDGREALAPLARTSSVQFTVSVSLKEAVDILNKLGDRSNFFLDDFPQDAVWKRYIRESLAGYTSDRYGGPLRFESLKDYCFKLSQHGVVQGVSLSPLESSLEVDLPLYLRSVWWHFRLKRYGKALCIEVRPNARRADEKIQQQLEKVLAIICK
jgi:hypothetical protein